jgi:NAD(P)-dependent dehydrogenase (short-subunit alcohol dehydrogenase family)
MEQNREKRWLVTGCGSGFGREIAAEALRRGHRVVVTSRSLDGLEELAAGVGDRCRLMQLDVTDEDLEEKARQAAALFGGIDVLVNNAGCALVGALEECSMDEVRANMETNFFGPLRLMRALLPELRRGGGGHIVNMSAAAAIANYPGFAAYGAAKAALEFASEAVRAEAGSLGVKVTLIEPGPFRTGFIGRNLSEAGRVLPEYAGTSGRFREMLRRMDGKQVGDPRRAAAFIVDLVEEGHSAFRVPLGKYALKKQRDRAAALLRDAEAVEERAAATDGAA